MHMRIEYILIIALLMGTLSVRAHAQGTQNVDDILPPVINNSFIEGSDILPDVTMRVKTHPENVLLGQYKLAKTVPDFDTMIKQSPIVLETQEMDRAAVALTEFNRLSNSYNLRDSEQEIVVHTRLLLDEYSSMQNAMIFDELDDQTFFRFEIYGENIGVVPKDIETFSRLRIAPSNAAAMMEELGTQRDVFAEFILIPEFADRTKPLDIDETSLWLMSAKIGEMRLWSSPVPESAQLLWYYKAPWYAPRNVTELDDLFIQ